MDTIRYSIRPYTLYKLAQVFNTTVDSIMALNPGIVPTNLQIGQVITIRPGEGGRFPLDSARFPATPTETPRNDVISKRLADLTNYLRLLWLQNVKWGRFATQSILGNLPGMDVAVQRFLQNSDDFANALRPFYGEQNAREFSDLLRNHGQIFMDLVRAAGERNMEMAGDLEQRWYDNASRMATFLARMNPEWYEADWNAMLNEHLSLMMTDVDNMIAGNYQEAVNLADTTEYQAIEMADIMAEGINRQFPLS